ncbi:MAG: ATP-binding protein [Blastocatellia bacterium]
MSSSLPQQSNTFSTGGGGTNFETRIQAAFTVLMLTGQIAPCLPSWPITKIKLQGNYEGFSTDDFIAFTKDPESQNEARLLGQIKHEINITKSDNSFPDVIKAAWRDFNDPSVFNPTVDALALITGPLSSVDTEHVRPILEWARHSQDEVEFLKKINTANFSSKEKKEKLEAFKVHLKSANGANVSDEELWKFLKCFHLLGYDLDTSSSVTLSLLQSLIAQYCQESSGLVWSRIIDVVQSANQNAGTITLATIPGDVRSLFNTRQSTSLSLDLRKLKEHGEYILNGISDSIGEVHISRQKLLDQLFEYVEKYKLVFISGERGCGKSSLVKRFYDSIKDKIPTFCFRVEDFDNTHLSRVFSSIGLQSSLSDLGARFALIPKKYLLIESIEKLLELQCRHAFRDLLSFISKGNDWTIIVTGRDYAYQKIVLNYLKQPLLPYTSLIVSNFDNDEVEDLCEKQPILKNIATNPSLKTLIKNPFLAELAYRVAISGKEFSNADGEREFIAVVWDNIIAKEEDRINGMPLKRKEVFIKIAVMRAKKMVYGIPETDFEAEVLLKLESDNLIRRDSSRGLVSLLHDVLEDIALERYIETNYQQNVRQVVNFLNEVGHEPAMNRAFRLWLSQKFKYGQNVEAFVMGVLRNEGLQKCWKDETISAILLSNQSNSFLERLKNQLLDKEGELLKRFCFILRISCKVPDNNLSNLTGDVFLKPYGDGWNSVIHFLFENKGSISNSLIPHVVKVLDEWCFLINIEMSLPTNTAHEAGLLAFHLLDLIKNWDAEDICKKIFSVIVKTVPAVENKFNEFLEDVFKSRDEKRRPPYIEYFCQVALEHPHTKFLCEYAPDALIKLAFYEWLMSESEKDEEFSWGGNINIEHHFGLRYEGSFFPASGAKGPFQYLLSFHLKKGLDFILGLVNFATEKYAYSVLDAPNRFSKPSLEGNNVSAKQLEIKLNDGTVIKQYYSDHLWLAYRGKSVVPYLLQSALMALENWLINFAKDFDNEEILDKCFNYILSNSNSVMTTAILVSLATGFPSKFKKSVLPILRVPQFYDLDLVRATEELGGNEPNWFFSQLGRESFAEVYMKERQIAALCFWRKKSLENLILELQFSNVKENVYEIIDELRSKVVEDKNWGFRFARIDTRAGKIIEDEEKEVIVFEPQLTPDLQKTQQESQEKVLLRNRFCKLYLWSKKVFDREPLDKEYYSSWEEALKETKDLFELLEDANTQALSISYYAGIVRSIAIFLRDHLSQMDTKDVKWCYDIVINQLQKTSNEGDRNKWILDETDLHSKTAIASIIPILLDLAKEESDAIKVKELIALAITHTNANVRAGIANGIREHLWQRDPEFAQQCFFAAINYARLEEEIAKERRKPNLRFTEYEEITQNINIAINSSLKCFQQEIVKSEVSLNVEDIDNFDFASHHSYFLSSPCLMIPNNLAELSHIRFFSRMLTLLFEISEVNAAIRFSRKAKIDFDDNLKIVFIKRFSQYLFYLLKIDKIDLFIDKLKSGCDEDPGLINSLLLQIAHLAEIEKSKSLYWKFWEKLSEKVQGIAAELNYDPRYENDKLKLINSMLKYITSWRTVDYEAEDMDLGKNLILDFVTNTGSNPDVFQAMASLMYRFPTIFLSAGISILAKHQKGQGGIQLFSRVNTAFYLEGAIEKFLQGDETMYLSREMHGDCLVLLDAMVEKASSTAYYLREQLVRSHRIN